MTGPGFTQGDDFVAARVSIDVPTEGLQSLKEMSNGINNFRTAVEAATRSSSSFVSYINQMVQAGNLATEAHRNLASQLERTADLQQRAMGGSGSAQQMLPISRSAPQGFVDNFAGMGVGMGSQRQPTTPQGLTTYQQDAIDPTRQLDPYKYVNAQAGRHRVLGSDFQTTQTGAPDMNEAANRVEARDKHQAATQSSNPDIQTGLGKAGFGGLARNIMNEMAVGAGSHVGMLGLAQKGLGAVAGIMGRPSAAAGGGSAGTATAQLASDGDAASAMARMAGGAAGGIGIGLAGLAAVEKGGSIIQGYKNLGSIRGGGAAEGLGSEMQMRTLALNPFISTEQSRQIIMAGLTEGYSGKTFDTMTDFIAHNLKEMNMSVAQSVQIARKNIFEGGQSVTGARASLDTLKEMAKTGSLSLPDMAAIFTEGSGAMVDRGASGGWASEQMLDALGAFKGDQTLKGKFAGMVQSGGSDMGSGGMIEQFAGVSIPGVPPDMMDAYMADTGMDKGKVTSSALKNMVQRTMGNAQKGTPRYYQGLRVFTSLLNRSFPGQNITPQVASHWVDVIRAGGDPSTEGKADHDAVTSQVNKVGRFSGSMSSLGEMASSIGQGAVDIGKMFVGGVSGLWNGNEGDQAAINAADDIGKRFDNFSYHINDEARNPVLQSVIGQYGASSIEIQGKDGKWGAPTGSKDQVQALASGQAKWRHKGDSGDGMTLAQTPADGRVPAGVSNTNVSFQPATVQINFGPNGQMTASPNPVQLTPNQQAANSGVGSAALNNPPPGDGYGYRPGQSTGLH